MASRVSSAKEYVRANRTFFLFALLLLVSVSGYFWWRSGFSFQFSRFFASNGPEINLSRGRGPYVHGESIGVAWSKDDAERCDSLNGWADTGGQRTGHSDSPGVDACGASRGAVRIECTFSDGSTAFSDAGFDIDSSTCPSAEHLACRNNSCTKVSGGGGAEDGCTFNGEACGTQPTYTCEDNGNQCVSGACPGGTTSGGGTCQSGHCCQDSGTSGQPPPPPNLTALPGTVPPGGTVNLHWTSSNATSCIVEAGNFAPIGLNGDATEVISGSAPQGTVVGFRIACSNAYGQTESNVANVTISGSPVTEHLECDPVQQTCRVVQGPGSDADGCTAPNQACTAGRHLACINSTCTSVEGSGGNRDGCNNPGQSCTTPTGAGICAGYPDHWGDNGVVVCRINSNFVNDRCTIAGPGQTMTYTLGIYNPPGNPSIYSKPAIFGCPFATCGAIDNNSFDLPNYPQGSCGFGNASLNRSGASNLGPGESGTVTYSFQVPDCGTIQFDDTWGPGNFVFVIGNVVNSNNNCPVSASHLTCQNNTCTQVAGAGANECSPAGSSCGSTPTHLVCQNNACTQVSGAGADQCSGVGSSCGQTHSACQTNNTCVSVAGAGTNECTTSADCQPATHTVCQNNACARVNGAGTNGCAIDADCVVTPALSCVGTVTEANIGTSVQFSATGGTGTYTWYAPGGVPFTLPGTPFSTTYAAAGFKTVTVVSGGNQATCTVQINAPVVTTPPATTPPATCTPAICATPRPGCHIENGSTCSCGQEVCPSNIPLACAPATQTVNINQDANFQASGGSSSTYSWTAPNGSPRTGSNQTFRTNYGSAGTYTVTVTAGSQSATCNVVVRPPATSPDLSIEKTVRLYPNGTEQESVTANPAQTVEFAIRVSSNGSGTATQVVVRDTLPSGLTYQTGTTTVDNVAAADGIIGSGLSLGDMAPGRTITVRFRALVAPAQFFGPGTSTMVNTAYAKAQNTSEHSDIAIVNVIREAPNASISLVKLGRNLTRNESGERSSVNADPAQTVEFILRTRNTSTVALTNVRLRDVVPQGITFIPGTVRLNGQAASDAIVTSGLPVGTLTPNQEAVVIFSGRVANAADLPSGITTLINTAYVTADNVPQLSAQLPVIITKSTVPVTQVPTGPGESTVLALIISAAITLLYVGYTGTDLYRRNEASALAGEKHDRFDFRR